MNGAQPRLDRRLPTARENPRPRERSTARAWNVPPLTWPQPCRLRLEVLAQVLPRRAAPSPRVLLWVVVIIQTWFPLSKGKPYPHPQKQFLR